MGCAENAAGRVAGNAWEVREGRPINTHGAVCAVIV